MQYDLLLVVPVAFLALRDGTLHGQVLLELLHGKLLHLRTPGFCNNATDKVFGLSRHLSPQPPQI